MTTTTEGPSLLDLAGERLVDLIDGPQTTLDEILRRLFDPKERDDLVTVSAFSSSL